MRWLFPTAPAALARRNLVLALLCALAALALVERAGRKSQGVLLANQAFGERFLEREDPYLDPAKGHLVHGPYPPSFALVAAPLATLPTPVARRAWAAAQVGALALLYVVLRRRLRRHAPALAAHAPVVFALALMLVSRYLLRDTKAGGGNLLYMTLAVVGLELALAGRRLLGGVPLGLSLVLKPNLAPFLVFLALRRRWSTLGATLGVAAVLFAAPALHFGLDDYARIAGRWAGDVARFAALEDLHDHAGVPVGMPRAEHAMNQSLRESVHRLLRPPGDTGAHDVHVLETSPGVATGVARALALALLAAVGWRTWRARGSLAEAGAALAFLPLCLLLSPITWKAHHVTLLPLFFALAALASSPAARPRWLVPGLWAYYVLCDLLSVEVVGDEGGDWLQAVSLVAWADVALVAACVALLGRLAREPATERTNPRSVAARRGRERGSEDGEDDGT